MTGREMAMVERDRNMVRFVPGDATAVVGDRLVALIDGGADAPLVNELHRLVVDRQETVEAVVATLVAQGPSSLPGLAVVIREDAGGRLFVRGGVVVDIDEGDGFVRIEGMSMATWIEHMFEACSEARLAVIDSEVSFDGTLYSASSGVLPAVGVELLWVDGDVATKTEAEVAPEAVADPSVPTNRAAGAEGPVEGGELPLPDVPAVESAIDDEADDPPRDEQGPVASSGPSEASLEVDADGADGASRAARAGETVIASDLLADPPPGPPGAEVEEVVAPAMIAPAEELQYTGNYDDLFGSTQFRSVENAAVRPDPSEGVGQDAPARATVGPSAADATDGDGGGESPDPVHDGRTVTLEELRRLRGDQPAAPDPTSTASSGFGTTVLAVLCPRGHPNAPHEVRCRRCDGLIESQDAIHVERPPLGLLVFSTGTVVPVERTMLIGRSPKASGLLADGRSPELVQVPSPAKDISRTHLEVRVEGWQVMAIDHNSANGTIVAMPGRADQRLRPDEPFLLAPGAKVRLADEVEFTLEANA
jgi:hypothetical protein